MTVVKPAHRVTQSALTVDDGAFFSHSENKAPTATGNGLGGSPTQPSSGHTAAGDGR
jgi:hypothetical protein